MEGEAQAVACLEQVGESVDVRGYVVWFLRREGGEELLDGFGEDEGFAC